MSLIILYYYYSLLCINLLLFISVIIYLALFAETMYLSPLCVSFFVNAPNFYAYITTYTVTVLQASLFTWSILFHIH
jgi:hypothetical protein